MQPPYFLRHGLPPSRKGDKVEIRRLHWRVVLDFKIADGKFISLN